MSLAVVDGKAPVAPSRGYAGPMKAFHWATVLLLAGVYALAWSIDGAGSHAQAAWLIMMHRSFGLSVLVLTAVRLAWRQRSAVPALPDDVPALQRLAARAVAMGLYLLLFLQPLLGLFASQAHGDHIVVFGAIPLPLVMAPDRALSRQIFALHGAVALVILGMVALHAAAALYHHFIRRDDVLRGMLPVSRKRGDAET